MASQQLMRAAADNNLKNLIKALETVDPDAGNAIGQTSLHVASIHGHIKIAEALIAAGATVNKTNQYGVTPLHYASQSDRFEVAQLLLANGANKRAKAGNDKMPCDMAKSDAMRALLGGGDTKLHRAIKSFDMRGLQSALSEGDDIGEPDSQGRTPFHLAAVAAVAIAKAQGAAASGEEGDRDSLAALKLLVSEAKSSEESLEELCYALDDEGINPLHVLVQGGHMAGIALLLEAGADPNGQSFPVGGEYTSGQWGKTLADGKKEVLRPEGDKTLLHMALQCEEPSDELIKLLLKHKADPNKRDMENQTALHLALDFHENYNGVELALAELLLEHGADPALGSNEIGMDNGCLHAAVISSDADALKLLLRKGAKHSAVGKGGFTPLTLAARSGAMGCIVPLLSAGADPDAKAPMGKSAREIATVNKRAKVLEAFDKPPMELS